MLYLNDLFSFGAMILLNEHKETFFLRGADCCKEFAYVEYVIH